MNFKNLLTNNLGLQSLAGLLPFRLEFYASVILENFGPMRKSQDIKYPNSARLFSFCKRVLDAKFSHARVIDQDVGEILGFDPADCSHWKKGRKQISSVGALASIAQHLGVDERLVIDVAMILN